MVALRVTAPRNLSILLKQIDSIMDKKDTQSPDPIAIADPHMHRVEPGSTVHLSQVATNGRDIYPHKRKVAEKEFKALREELAEWQHKLYSAGKHSLLIVLQAMDAGGKDGTIRRVFEGVNPQGVKVASFKAPTSEELSHDFLWRIHQEAPAKGMIGVFNRSHYEDVLIVRVLNLVPQSIWEPRYQHINNFENLLADSGTIIRKFYLHISKDEQKERLQERLDDPTKHWKFDAGDLKQRAHWDKYQEAFADMLGRCSTETAPWYVIPANQKWYRNLAITRVLVHTLRELNPQYPENSDDLSKIKID